MDGVLSKSSELTRKFRAAMGANLPWECGHGTVADTKKCEVGSLLHRHAGIAQTVIASAAKQSILSGREEWIASSLRSSQ
jgi:hypothetical protein